MEQTSGYQRATKECRHIFQAQKVNFPKSIGGGGGGVLTSLQPFLGHSTLKRMSNVCLHISCDDIITRFDTCTCKYDNYC